MREIRRGIAIVRFRDGRAAVKEAGKAFYPYAGESLARLIKSRIGHYTYPGFPDLAELAESTKRKKRASLRRMKKPLNRRMQVVDSPLIDQGRMVLSTSSRAKGDGAHVTMSDPMRWHEQDKEVGAWSPPPNRLPARPVMGPALELAVGMPKLLDKLEKDMVDAL